MVSTRRSIVAQHITTPKSSPSSSKSRSKSKSKSITPTVNVNAPTSPIGTLNLSDADSILQKLVYQDTVLLDNQLDSIDHLFNKQIDYFIAQVESMSNSAKNYSIVRKLKYNSVPVSIEPYKKQWHPTEKKFIERESLLTIMFKKNEYRTIYNIFLATFIVYGAGVLFKEYFVNNGVGFLQFTLLQWVFSDILIALTIWFAMFCSTFIIVPMNYFYHRGYLPLFLYSFLYIIYQIALFIFPAYAVSYMNLRPGSSVIVLCEQARLTMKIHSFLRENQKMVNYQIQNHHDASDSDATESVNKQLITSFVDSLYAYAYFLFVPTLIYRNSYPRTNSTNWYKVFTLIIEIIGCVFSMYVVVERFWSPEFQMTAKNPGDLKDFLLSLFKNACPAIVAYLITFYLLLHCWMNLFAEITRFADRQFYEDWWNSVSFSMYYRKWNVVVHDWLYAYAFLDVARLGWSKTAAMFFCFFISALIHEHILSFTFHFFYPVLFFLFAGVGVSFIFLTRLGKGSKHWNLFMWANLSIGNAVNVILYAREFYARYGAIRPDFENEDFKLTNLPWYKPASWHPFMNYK